MSSDSSGNDSNSDSDSDTDNAPLSTLVQKESPTGSKTFYQMAGSTEAFKLIFIVCSLYTVCP